MTHRILKLAIGAVLSASATSPSSAQNVSLDQVLFESSEHLRLGQPAIALEVLNDQFSRFEKEPEFLNNLAIAYLGNNDPERALSILRTLVEEDPLFSIIGHNLLEMELGAAGLETDQVNPILFVQSVNSFSTGIPAREQRPPTPEKPEDKLLEAALRATIQSWADAWSNKDFSRYISHYAENFTPENTSSLAVWREGRSTRLQKPGEISVTISNLEIFPDAVSPSAQFDQTYESTTYRDKTRKEMIFTQDNDRWKIRTETTIKIY